MTVARSRVFTTNRRQAARLPKAVAFPGSVHQVAVIKIGNARLITSAGHRWDEFFCNGPHVNDDFLNERDQGVAEEREPL